MDTALWVVQGLLAVVFLMVGVAKLIQPKEKIAAQMAWANDFDQNTIGAIGTVEILGAIGLIAPMLTNILTVLTPLAAVGLMLDMMGAAYTHYRRKEYPFIAANTVLFLLAAFVAYGRFVLVPPAVG